MDFMILWFIIIAVAVIVAAVFFRYVPVGLWINARASGAPVKIVSLVGMRFRRISPQKIVNAYIKARKAGLSVSTDMLETHYLAGGNVERVINALISAKQASITLSFTKDGIELRAKARVTVRTNIDRLVGGAGEETIIARVGEGIVTTIGSSETHKAVLENPDLISQTVLNKGLDAGTAYEILSIDIADVDVGRNIGAQLQMDQAEADRRIAQAKAEERRAMAVAHEQEMKAAVQEMRAKVVEAEAQVPLAMAEALREGKLGVMDYYQMQNTIADTEMRSGIARAAAPAADAAKPLNDAPRAKAAK